MIHMNSGHLPLQDLCWNMFAFVSFTCQAKHANGWLREAYLQSQLNAYLMILEFTNFLILYTGGRKSVTNQRKGCYPMNLCYLSSMCVLSHVWLCDPMDCSPPGSSVHGIFQARILEWSAISSGMGSSLLKDQTHVCWVSCIGRQILYHHLGSPVCDILLSNLERHKRTYAIKSHN